MEWDSEVLIAWQSVGLTSRQVARLSTEPDHLEMQKQSDGPCRYYCVLQRVNGRNEHTAG